MTPNARYQAAIEILDTYLDGRALDPVLTQWSRQNRFAGSKDRAAIRDIVFDCVRRRAEYAHLGGALSGRSLVLGLSIAQEIDPESIFTGTGYAPSALSEEELSKTKSRAEMPSHVRANLPDWLLEIANPSLIPEFEIQTARADLFLRVNVKKASIADALRSLENEGIEAAAFDAVDHALIVKSNERRVKEAKALKNGWIEIQDAGSIAVTQSLSVPTEKGARILDFCSGGGGKALAIAALSEAEIFAHDINPARMKDIPNRANRAGVTIQQLDTKQAMAQKFDYVLLDVPCSGSGAWRRNPEAKWSFTKARLDELAQIQRDILGTALTLLKDGGRIGYITCSIFDQENDDQIDRFLQDHPNWTCSERHKFWPSAGHDGFYAAELTQN